MHDEICRETEEALAAFPSVREAVYCQRFGSGHINDTYLVKCAGNRPWYVLQRINREVFKDPEALMGNMRKVTEFLRAKILARGGDPDRETLTLLPARDGRKFHTDSRGDCWRLTLYITGSASYDRAEKPEDLYRSGRGFGMFQRLLADFPAAELHETIPDFHHTPARLAALNRAAEADTAGHAGQVKKELDFVYAREAETRIAADMLREGKLPLRVTHNDTKLNNILFDRTTGEALCVIDLDTVMPGLAIFDFGDSIRFGAGTGAEDEPDPGRISLSLTLFEAYAKGFLEGCGGSLTETETAMLPMGAILMTLECGIRFLTDYLEGSTYFRTAYPEHNLVRARAQFALAADMERKRDEMAEIVSKCAGRAGWLHGE